MMDPRDPPLWNPGRPRSADPNRREPGRRDGYEDYRPRNNWDDRDPEQAHHYDRNDSNNNDYYRNDRRYRTDPVVPQP